MWSSECRLLELNAFRASESNGHDSVFLLQYTDEQLARLQDSKMKRDPELRKGIQELKDAEKQDEELYKFLGEFPEPEESRKNKKGEEDNEDDDENSDDENSDDEVLLVSPPKKFKK